MPGKILGIDISEDTVTAVQILGGLKGYQVTACAQVMMDEDGGVEETLKKLSEQIDLQSDVYVSSIPAEQASYRNLRMPFTSQKKIRQTLPFELETVVPIPIGDLIVDFTIIDRADESEILGASVKKDYVAQYLAQMQTHGIDPEVLDIRCVPVVSWLLKQEKTPDNGLFLEIGGKRNMMILFLKKRIALVRSFAFDGTDMARSIADEIDEQPDHFTAEEMEARLKSFCTTVRNTIHAFGWQGKKEDILPEKAFFTGIGALYPGAGELLGQFLDIPVEQINLRGDKSVQMDSGVARVWNSALMDNALALALRHDRNDQGFNFRKDEFGVSKRYSGFKTEIRKVAIFFVLILAFLTADLGTDYYFLKQRYEGLDQNIVKIFKKTAPDVKRNVKSQEAISIIEGRIKELKASNASLPGVKGDQKVLDLLNDISKRVSQTMEFHVTTLIIDPDTVRISGDTDTFSTADSIRKALETSAYFNNVTLDKTSQDRTGERIKFDIKLQRTI